MGNLGNEFSDVGFFVFRTPLLSFDRFLEISNDLEAPKFLDNPGELESALKRDRGLISDRLKKIYEIPEVLEALWLASPDLYDNLQIWRNEPQSERARKIELSLYQYFIRMSTRPTPFALFAGYSIGTLGKQTNLTLGGRETYKRSTQIHIEYLSSLVDKVLSNRVSREALVFFPNSTLYSVNEQLKYARVFIKDQKRTHQIVVIQDSPFIQFVLERSRSGKTMLELSNLLVAKYRGLSLEQAKTFLNDLIEQQVVLPEISPLVTGPDPIEELKNQLSVHPETMEWGNVLKEICEEINTLDSKGIGLNSQIYRKLEDSLNKISENSSPAQNLSYPIQINFRKETPNAMLEASVSSEVLKAAYIFQKIDCLQSQQFEELEQFRTEFVDRYEQQEIPLVDALDPDIGVGYRPVNVPFYEISPLLGDATLPDLPTKKKLPEKLEAFFLSKLEEALFERKTEITVDIKELDLLATDVSPFPNTFSMQLVLSASSQEAFSSGKYHIIPRAIVAPGAVFLGRFCQSDPELFNYVEPYLRAEEKLQPDAHFAEFVYLPPDYIATLVVRPVYRDYEIPYLGRSGAPLEKQIPITDLLVSVRGSQIILRSASLQCEIIPRRTSPHAHPRRANYLPMYQFLFALQRLYGGGFASIWEPLGACAPFLPRVVSGRLILSPALWKFKGDELKILQNASKSEIFRKLQQWRVDKKLPRYIQIGQGDNFVTLDLENSLSVELLSSLAKKKNESLTIAELLPEISEFCITGPEGKYMHELIFPFVRKQDSNAPSQAPSNFIPHKMKSESKTQRTFLPGSEWLFVKFYASPLKVDEFLMGKMEELLKEALSSHYADHWFFIRYSDPQWHLRLRFQGEPNVLHKKIVPIIEKYADYLIKKKMVWKVQFDTYVREIERYGGEKGILLAEKLFQFDSEAVISILKTLSSTNLGDTRWRITLCGIDMLLNDLGFDLPAKHAFMKNQYNVYTRINPKTSSEYKELVATRFRNERKNLEELLTFKSQDRAFQKCFDLLNRRSKRLKPTIQKLKNFSENGKLTLSIPQLASSYVHMHVNRMLKGTIPMEESTLYFFLMQLYLSKIESSKNKE